MSAYHQLGHDSKNLIRESSLNKFRGAFISPTNYTEEQTRKIITEPPNAEFEFIFDPQLYFPNTSRGMLPKWGYFPADVDTADHSNPQWWTRLFKVVHETAVSTNCHTCCVPAIVPRSYSNAFYQRCVENASEMVDLSAGRLKILNTIILNFSEMGQINRAEELASIVSNSAAKNIYLIIASDIEPRREFSDVDSLIGVYRFINLLENADVRVTVGFCSSDVVLWKAAGASNCATGKFFNLRRFTPSRWDPATGGGGQLPYWMEEGLIAYLRESDILRVRQTGVASDVSESLPHSAEILEKINIGSPWLGESWRHYLEWFASIEARIELGITCPKELLAVAERNSLHLDDKGTLMEEPRNNFSWLRPWRRVLSEA